jgi:hypothetical protein
LGVAALPRRPTRYGAGRSSWRFLMSYLKQKLAMPLVKYSILTVAACLWVFGLIEQIYSSAAVMKYVLMSLLMAAVAFLI